MAKIFQLELFIKEMSIWRLPHGSEDHDETCVEVSVFDDENVPINGYVFGKNSTINRGQSFLFTLTAMPVDDDKVVFNIFKKAYNREKNLLGGGTIPMCQIFGDLFSNVFKDVKPIKAPQNQTSTTQPADQNQLVSADASGKSSPATKPDAQQNASATSQKNTKQKSTTGANSSQTNTAKSKSSTKIASAKDQKNAKQSAGPDPNNPSTTSGQEATAQQSATQSQSPTNPSAPTTQDNASVDPNAVATKSPQPKTAQIQNLKTTNVTGKIYVRVHQ